MAREFQEEADLVVPPDDWRHFLRLVGADYEVECFLAFATHPEWVGSPESEFVTVCSVDNLPPVIPNVRWMIAMALSFQRGETARSFVVQEVTA